jgi:hypothetical protein
MTTMAEQLTGYVLVRTLAGPVFVCLPPLADLVGLATPPELTGEGLRYATEAEIRDLAVALLCGLGRR